MVSQQNKKELNEILSKKISFKNILTINDSQRPALNFLNKKKINYILFTKY